MKKLLFMCVLCIVSLRISETLPKREYVENKLRLQTQEMEASIGGQLQLNSKEEEANKVLMYFKNKELDEMYKDPKKFYFKNNFFQYTHVINESMVYKIIKFMPKGGALHLHSSVLLDADSLVKLTYEKHAYACIGTDTIQFNFSLSVPKQRCSTDWILLEDLRHNTNDVQAFDQNLKKYFLLDMKLLENSDINTIWYHFEKVISNVQTLLRYRPVYEQYYNLVLNNFYNDKVKYMEIRGSFRFCYELDGTVRDTRYIINMLRNVIEQFKKDKPSFIGVKLILSKYRGKDLTSDEMEQHKSLIDEFSDILIGFDLVGQEDRGKPLSDFTRVFRDVQDNMDFYFHAGETNWLGGSTDDNLYDSVLLHTKRIGHAYSLTKHPVLMKMVKEQDIAIELNALSNAVLGLVTDLRNHPAAILLADGMPVVISSDDPGIWGADPLSHDFFVTFMALASRQADLRMLKQLALNSIKYSALNENDKSEFEKIFHKCWMKFINLVTKNFCKWI